MEKYCKNCGRVFKNSDFKMCPYCGNSLSTRQGRQSIPRKLRHQVFQRDGYKCRECGATNKQTRLHVDHIVPVAKGGTNDLSNLQTLCEECNMAKYTDEWVGGSSNYSPNEKYKHENMDIDNDLTDLNEKQREINLIRHIDKEYKQNKVKFSTENSKNILNEECSLVVEEFEKCNDINVVSKKLGISSIDIKRWYRKGKNGDLDYLDFYEVLSNLNPNMEIKGFDLEQLSLSDKLNYVASSFRRYKDIKLVSEHTGVSEIQIRKWFKQGKRGQWPYKDFYDEISIFMGE